VTIALQVLVSGLAAGGVYGLFAAGYSLIYRLTGIVHFAFGDLVGLGIFATLLVLAGTTPVSQAGAHEPRFVFALLVGLVVCVAAGIGTYVGLVQPYVSRGSTIGWVAGTVAVAFAIRAIIGTTFQRSSYVFPDPLPFHDIGRSGFVRIAGAQVEARAFFVFGLAVALALGAAWFLEHSRYGRALRAVPPPPPRERRGPGPVADDREGARVVGVPVELLVTLAFGLVGALAMIAAIAAAPGEAVNANTGTLLGLKGLVAALAVRFGPSLLAFGAGLVLGVGEAAIANVHLGGWQLGPSYRELLPLLFVLLLISLRPSPDALEERE
jgi:branched-chain amino acid transport system permease protein